MDKGRVVLVLVMLSFFVLKILTIKSAVFVADTGGCLLDGKRILETGKIPFYGSYSSQGIPQGPVSIYLCTLSLLFGQTMHEIEIFFAFFHILTIYAVFMLGKAMYNEWVGILGGFLYGISPPMLFYYSYYSPFLPFFVTVMMYLSHRIVKEKNQKYFIPLSIATALAVDTHLLAFFLIPVPVAYLLPFTIERIRAKKLNLKYVSMSVFLFIAMVSSILYYNVTKPGDLVYILETPEDRSTFYSHVKNMLYLSGVSSSAFIREFVDMLDAAGILPDFISLESLIVIGFFIYGTFNIFRKNWGFGGLLLYLWLLIPTVFFYLSGNFLHISPPQWALIYFPAPLIIAAGTVYKAYRVLLERRQRILFYVVFVVWIAKILVLTCSVLSFIDYSGGVGGHESNLIVKEDVMKYILSRDNNPKIIIVEDTEWVHALPYLFLKRTMSSESNHTEDNFYYVLETRSCWFPESYMPVIAELGCNETLTFKSVDVCVSDEYMEIGTRI